MLGSEFHFREKIPVAILGATGSVGQRFVELLSNHPWFDVVALAASERSVGKPYREAVNWLMNTPLPEHIGALEVRSCSPDISVPLVFSALDASIAGGIETQFAEKGFVVVSNASSHRMQPHVPLLIPEVNAAHLELIKSQPFTKGKIVANPNCSAIGLSIALKPLHDFFGIEAVHVVTMQAVSGAGYPGVASLDILDNVIPFINGEEQKLEQEPLKILGTFANGEIEEAAIAISAQCNRVAVVDGHMECVSLRFKKKPEASEIIEAWRTFSSEAQHLMLPMAPKQTIHYFQEHHYPQPKLHRQADKGMAVNVGRLRHCPLFDYKFTLLSHNTIRGAAGGAVLCAELMVRKGFIFW